MSIREHKGAKNSCKIEYTFYFNSFDNDLNLYRYTVMSPNLALYFGTLKFNKIYFVIESDNRTSYLAKL